MGRSLALGNGHLGAMVYGRTENEIISLNDDTLWSGVPSIYTNTYSADALSVIRQLVNQEKYFEVGELVKRKMLAQYTQVYMPLGDVHIQFLAGKAESYERK